MSDSERESTYAIHAALHGNGPLHVIKGDISVELMAGKDGLLLIGGEHACSSITIKTQEARELAIFVWKAVFDAMQPETLKKRAP